MANILTKLANPLPRLAIPLASPNGDVLATNYDPYLELANSWANVLGLVPRDFKNYGNYFKVGDPATVLMYQDSSTHLAPHSKAYLELKNLNGNIFFSCGGSIYSPVVSEPGAYIWDFDTSSYGSFGIFKSSSFYTPDPYFKKVPVGDLPLTGAVAAPGFFQTNSGYVSKGSDNRIRVRHFGAYMAQVNHKDNIPNGTVGILTVKVDYIPPGGGLALGEMGAGTSLVISSAGDYRIPITRNTAFPIGFCNMEALEGGPESIISFFQFKAQSHSGPAPDELFIQPTCLWAAEASLFDAVIKPETYVAVNQYDVGGAFESSPTPKLGYCGYLPPVGNYNVGDIIRNTNFVSGQPSGWKCTAAGNPGTWQPLAIVP